MDAYVPTRIAKSSPLAILSPKLYAPYTNAEEVLSSPMTSEIRLVETFSKIEMPTPYDTASK